VGVLVILLCVGAIEAIDVGEGVTMGLLVILFIVGAIIGGAGGIVDDGTHDGITVGPLIGD
jgi:hypothetical protein